MFVGHYATGLIGKKGAPGVNLGWLVTAGALADVAFTVLLLVGVEHARVAPGLTPANPLDLYDFPWSHSLLFGLVWAVGGGAAWWAWRKDRRTALLIGLLVFGHWVLDFASHIPDLALWPGAATKVGLGLWRSVPLTLVVEGGMWIGALAVYARATRPLNRRGSWGFWTYAAVVTLLYAMSFVGPPPPDIRVVAYSGLLGIPLLVWPAWFDRHRAVRGRPTA